MKPLKVKSISQVGKGDVYDISVDQYENYILENGIISHNSGLKYTASTIVELGKAQDKDGTEIVGGFIRCKTYKSRLTKEKSQVRVRLNYKTGLDRYYGLLDIATKYGIFNKVSTRIELPDGTKIFGKQIENNPEKYFTPDILDKIDEACKKEFLYGQSDEIENVDEVEDNADVSDG